MALVLSFMCCLTVDEPALSKSDRRCEVLWLLTCHQNLYSGRMTKHKPSNARRTTQLLLSQTLVPETCLFLFCEINVIANQLNININEEHL